MILDDLLISINHHSSPDYKIFKLNKTQIE